MLSRICLSCDRKNAPDAKFCSECGAPLQLKLCRHCHKANDYAAHFCQSCGKSLPYADPDTPSAASGSPTSSPPPAEPGRNDGVAVEVESAAVKPAPGTSTIVKAFSPPPPVEAVAVLPTAVGIAVADVAVQPAAGAGADLVDQSSYPLPAVITVPPSGGTTRRQGTRGAGLALAVLALGVAVAVIALVGRDRAIQLQPAQSEPKAAPTTAEAPPARDAAAAAATVPSPAASAEPAAPPAQASALPLSPSTERRDAEPSTPVRRTSQEAVESAPPPRPVPPRRSAPARECTTELAVLGLCTLPDQTERK